MEKNYVETVIDFVDNFAFVHCGICVRDFGHSISIVDGGAKHGVIIFSVKGNETLASKLRDKSVKMTDLVVSAGAKFISPEGERIKTTSQWMVVPSAYDYNWRVRFVKGYIGALKDFDHDECYKNSVSEYSSFEDYVYDYGRSETNDVIVYYEGEQYFIHLERGTEWQNGRPHCTVNHNQYEYKYGEWVGYNGADSLLLHVPAIHSLLNLFLISEGREL